MFISWHGSLSQSFCFILSRYFWTGLNNTKWVWARGKQKTTLWTQETGTWTFEATNISIETNCITSWALGNIVFLIYIKIWWDLTRSGKIWWDLSRSVGLLRSVKFYWDLSGNVSIWIKISNMLPVRLPLHVSWSDADLDNSFLWLLHLRSWRLNLLFGFLLILMEKTKFI